MSSPVPVFIVEDQGMFRSFLEFWINGQSEYTVVGTAGSGEDALELLEISRPGLLVVDLHLPQMDGLQFVQLAKQRLPGVRALIVSALMDAFTLIRVKEGGVEGYIEKDAEPSDLSAAFKRVSEGGRYFSDRFTQVLREDKGREIGRFLSRREQQVVEHVLAGKTNRDVALILGVSSRTVEFHRANAMAKLGAKNLGELSRTVRQWGLEGDV
jgi:DNA-binding NarL/FixJ family response regulator